MAARHLLSVADLTPAQLIRLLDDSVVIAAGEWESRRPLDRKVVGIYFKKTSTRTRTAFTVGALKLGAAIIAYGPNDLQISTGETVRDTGRVLANFLDVLVVRTNESVEEMREFAENEKMPVVNAMSDNEHPTQAIADLSTLKEVFGRLDGLHVLYLGEGNNTAASLALAIGQVQGMKLTIVTPPGYGLARDILARAQGFAEENGSYIEQHHRVDALPKVDAVYTARWTTMGVPKADPDWLDKFRPYAVTPQLMDQVSKRGTIFMHDLPAIRGYEVRDEVLDGPQSVAFRQAFHKMASAMSVLNWCVNG